MHIKFTFSLNIDGNESIAQQVEYTADEANRAKILAIDILRQLGNAKVDAQLEPLREEVYAYSLGSTYETPNQSKSCGLKSILKKITSTKSL